MEFVVSEDLMYIYTGDIPLFHLSQLRTRQCIKKGVRYCFETKSWSNIMMVRSKVFQSTP